MLRRALVILALPMVVLAAGYVATREDSRGVPIAWLGLTFDSQLWNAARRECKQHRYVRDLVKSEALLGLSETRLFEILGPPDSSYDHTRSYTAACFSTDPWGLLWGARNLTVDLGPDGTVQKVQVIPW